MKLQSIKKGFTLIELLVVITIIGILATGATAVYTAQIQKARDAVRINDINSLQSGIEQYYQDVFEYPSGDDFDESGTNYNNVPTTWVQSYVPKIPWDSKNGQPCNDGGWSVDVYCGYVYFAWQDDNGIRLGEYEISTAFEASGNVTSKWNGDDGNDPLRFEKGLDLGSNVTTLTTAPASSPTIALQATTKVLINGWAFVSP